MLDIIYMHYKSGAGNKLGTCQDVMLTSAIDNVNCVVQTTTYPGAWVNQTVHLVREDLHVQDKEA